MATSAIEVAESGELHTADNRGLHCFRDLGGRAKLEWSSTWDALQLETNGRDTEAEKLREDIVWTSPYSLHFTPAKAGGDIAFQTHRGVVALVRRANGQLVDFFDVPARLGFVNTRYDPISIVDELGEKHAGQILKRWLRHVGPMSPQQLQLAMLGFFGGSGAFCDNTIAAATRRQRHQLFMVGGGPSEQFGALVALDIVGCRSNCSVRARTTTVMRARHTWSAGMRNETKSADTNRAASG